MCEYMQLTPRATEGTSEGSSDGVGVAEDMAGASSDGASLDSGGSTDGNEDDVVRLLL